MTGAICLKLSDRMVRDLFPNSIADQLKFSSLVSLDGKGNMDEEEEVTPDE